MSSVNKLFLAHVMRRRKAKEKIFELGRASARSLTVTRVKCELQTKECVISVGKDFHGGVSCWRLRVSHTLGGWSEPVLLSWFELPCEVWSICSPSASPKKSSLTSICRITYNSKFSELLFYFPCFCDHQDKHKFLRMIYSCFCSSTVCVYFFWSFRGNHVSRGKQTGCLIPF